MRPTMSSAPLLRWRRHPEAVLDGRIITTAGHRGEDYSLRWPVRRRVYLRLADVRKEEDALAFVRQHGFLRADQTRMDYRIFLQEADLLRAAVEVWSGLRDPRTLKGFNLRAAGGQRLRSLFVGSDQEFEDEWKRWRQYQPEGISLFAPFWLDFTLRVRLRPAGLRLVSKAVPDFLADLPSGGTSLKDAAEKGRNPFLEEPWTFALTPPDLRTFIWVELALDIAGRKMVSLCPYCGRFYLVTRTGVQQTCGMGPCRKESWRRARALREAATGRRS